MEQRNVDALFMDKFFSIPEYQRDYAWEDENVRQLVEDIKDALDTGVGHYIGTFILSKGPRQGDYRVVDGQQRITTLTMFIRALISQLSPQQENLRVIYSAKFVEWESRGKLQLAGDNDAFFRDLLAGSAVDATTRGQRRLKDAWAFVCESAKALKAQNQDLGRWLDCVRTLQVLEFVEGDEGRAIRIFETVNDRGVALTNMDKTKSLLVYYSNRFAAGRFDEMVNSYFGQIFRDYDDIRDIAEDERYDIALLKQKNFTEDFVLRWHFLASESDEYDFNATEDSVLAWLRRRLRKERDRQETLSKFLEFYVSDLRDFFRALCELLRLAVHNARYYKLFCVLGPSTWLYPLLIRLQMRGLLDTPVPGSPHFTFADLIEITDVRVYKARGTDPRRDICFLARDSMKLEPHELSRRLLDFAKRFMDDSEFKRRLTGDVYTTMPAALPHIFFSWDEEIMKRDGDAVPYDRINLINLRLSSPTIEHIFAETPPFDFPNFGFPSDDDYAAKNHKLGNLLLLEKAINSACRDKTVEQKLAEPNLYAKSKFRGVRRFRADHQAGNSLPFRGPDIENRTEELANFCLRRWPQW